MNMLFASKETSTRTDRTLDKRRAHIHAMWSAVAPAWAQHADYVDHTTAGITKALLELSAPQPGERVLEVACGPGGLGMAAAAMVGPTGHVVLSDVAVEMVELAGRRVAEAGLTNVRARVRDIEAIDEADDAFDIVLCREGLMFALDPAQAAREIHRVIRPDGRVALAVWGPRVRNPWLGIVLDCVSAQLGHAAPATWHAGPVRAGGCPATCRYPEASRTHGRDGDGIGIVPTHGFLRRMVGAHVGARRPDCESPSDAVGSGHAGIAIALAGSNTALRDSYRDAISRRHVDRIGATPNLPECKSAGVTPAHKCRLEIPSVDRSRAENIDSGSAADHTALTN